MLSFHWNRGQSEPVPYPHLHCAFSGEDEWAPIDRKTHVPCGRVALEDIVFFAIRELHVRPLRDDWSDVLAKHRRAFIEYKTTE
jgi:hypothetical protein